MELPDRTDWLGGVMLNENSLRTTDRLPVAKWVAEGAVPTTLNGARLADGVAAVVESVRVEVPPAVMVGGEKDAVTPGGRLAVERVMVSAAPDRRVVVTV